MDNSNDDVFDSDTQNHSDPPPYSSSSYPPSYKPRCSTSTSPDTDTADGAMVINIPTVEHLAITTFDHDEIRQDDRPSTRTKIYRKLRKLLRHIASVSRNMFEYLRAVTPCAWVVTLCIICVLVGLAYGIVMIGCSLVLSTSPADGLSRPVPPVCRVQLKPSPEVAANTVAASVGVPSTVMESTETSSIQGEAPNIQEEAPSAQEEESILEEAPSTEQQGFLSSLFSIGKGITSSIFG